MPDGKWVSSWKDRDGRQQSGIVSMFEAHQPDGVERRPHPAAKRALSLRQNDLVAVEPNGQARRIMRVVKFFCGSQITFAEQQEAGPLKEMAEAPRSTHHLQKFYSYACDFNESASKQALDNKT